MKINREELKLDLGLDDDDDEEENEHDVSREIADLSDDEKDAEEEEDEVLATQLEDVSSPFSTFISGCTNDLKHYLTLMMVVAKLANTK